MNLIETKEKKENLLIEEKIIESRLMMIFENKENINNFDSLFLLFINSSVKNNASDLS